MQLSKLVLVLKERTDRLGSATTRHQLLNRSVQKNYVNACATQQCRIALLYKCPAAHRNHHRAATQSPHNSREHLSFDLTKGALAAIANDVSNRTTFAVHE